MELIEEIEKRYILINNIDSTIDRLLQQAEALRQSILKRAFEEDKNV